MLKFVTRFLGESNQRSLDKIQPLVGEINALEPEFQALSDNDLRSLGAGFRERFKEGESLDDLLPEVFAAVREAAVRHIGMRHFDVQLLGGIVLHQGKIAEMKTGEGKTLVATLAASLNALEGSVHIVTVNDYLAKRDAAWMGPVYDALGLSVGCLQNGASWVFDPEAGKRQDGNDSAPDNGPFRAATKQEAYAADITYGTNNEFGFDYLRDNMVDDLSRKVQGPLRYAIVDEVDNILIDEARTPLIISGPAPDKGQEYRRFAQIARQLAVERDFTIDEKNRAISLTQEGISRVEKLLNVANLYDPANYLLTHYVENAIRAEHVYLRDRDYVVRDGEVVIVDEFTGRLMTGRRYSEGLHQAIEAKEGVRVQRESITYATITLQNYFRMYDKLAGMTGTAATEAEEFDKIYHVDVVQIPTNRPMIRTDLPDLIYKTEAAKFRAVAKAIEELHRAGRPVLVGTASIEVSERLSEMLKRRGIPHEVLNAKNHAREAVIVAQAGRPGAVTVATNMAGRGTDIILGGNPEHIGLDPAEWQRDHDRVVERGGLAIIGTERHEARRIDNQLRGRAGRQGDPGESRFYVSTEDELMRRFGGDRIKTIMNMVGLEEDVPIENKMVSKAVESAQTRVEGYHFEIRKHLVDYDDVINTHREVIYKLRDRVLAQDGLRSTIEGMIEKELRALVRRHLQGDPMNWEVDAFYRDLGTLMPVPDDLGDPDCLTAMAADEIEEALVAAASALYDQRTEEFGPEAMALLERHILLRAIDSHWVEHLTAVENMRQGIGLQAVGQRDPLVQYKSTAYGMFEELVSNIDRDVAHTIFRVAPTPHLIQRQQQRADGRPEASRAPAGAPSAGRAGGRGRPTSAVLDRRSVMAAVAGGHGRDAAAGSRKIGRNEPCPCGSGKKYKRCHGGR